MACQGKGEQYFPSKERLQQSGYKIESLYLSKEDISSENFIVEAEDVNPNVRSRRDTLNGENDQKQFNEILKAKAEWRNPLSGAATNSRLKTEQKKLNVPEKEIILFDTQADEYTGSGDDNSTTEGKITNVYYNQN